MRPIPSHCYRLPPRCADGWRVGRLAAAAGAQHKARPFAARGDGDATTADRSVEPSRAARPGQGRVSPGRPSSAAGAGWSVATPTRAGSSPARASPGSAPPVRPSAERTADNRPSQGRAAYSARPSPLREATVPYSTLRGALPRCVLFPRTPRSSSSISSAQCPPPHADGEAMRRDVGTEAARLGATVWCAQRRTGERARASTHSHR
jgi:hypothetical protein